MEKTQVDDHPHFYDKTDETLVRTLIEAGTKVRTAESCTGGGLMNRLTDVAGSSRIMDLSVLAYSPQVKQRLLRVPASRTTDATIVSQETAECMRKGLAALATMLTGPKTDTCQRTETSAEPDTVEAMNNGNTDGAPGCAEEACWYVGITGWLGPAPPNAGPELSDTVFVSLECTLLNYTKTFCFSTATIKSASMSKEKIEQDKATKKRAVVHRILLELVYSTTEI